MPRILVTGAAGFIGRHFIGLARKEGHVVLPYTREAGDVSRQETWADYDDADVVVHLAGRSYVPQSWSEPSGFLDSNVNGTLNALEYCRSRGARLVYLSSYLYGTPAKLPISEAAPLRATSPYALSKLLAEQACEFYAGNFRVKTTVLRPFNVYGPGQAEYFLIPTIVAQLRHRAIVVKDLSPRRDYVYVADLCSAILAACGLGSDYAVYNIGSGTSYSVGQIIDILQQLYRSELPVQCTDQPRALEIPDCVADSSAARRELHWLPQYSIREGLASVIQELA